MMQGVEDVGTPKTTKKTATPKSKKRQLETDGDDEESPATQKGNGKGGVKKVKVDEEAEEKLTKAEPDEEDSA